MAQKNVKTTSIFSSNPEGEDLPFGIQKNEIIHAKKLSYRKKKGYKRLPWGQRKREY
jgi:hypothetical protein